MNPADSQKKTMLYFQAGANATDAEKEKGAMLAETVGASVRFRNGAVPTDGNNEPCDYVAGSAPGAYRLAFPYVGADGTISQAPKIEEAKDPVNLFAERGETPASANDGASSLADEIGSSAKPPAWPAT